MQFLSGAFYGRREGWSLMTDRDRLVGARAGLQEATDVRGASVRVTIDVREVDLHASNVLREVLQVSSNDSTYLVRKGFGTRDIGVSVELDHHVSLPGVSHTEVLAETPPPASEM